MAFASLAPRPEIARSTMCASTNAPTRVSTAVMTLRLSVQNESAMGRLTARMSAQAIEGRGRSTELRYAGLVFLWSRAAVFLVAVLAVAVLGVAGGNEANFDVPGLTHPLGGALSPLARWDSTWYLGIAHSGYQGESTAFFPLYPVLVRGLAVVNAPGALLVASYVVSLAAFFGALVLLQRLVSLELRSERIARLSVLMLALFPGALWFGAPYSESLFLLLSVGAFSPARTGHWAWAGTCAPLASATRSAGLVLLLPLLVLWWQAGRRPRDLGWIALAPLGLAGDPALLAVPHRGG